jgi:hypothetical protein
LNQMSTSVVVSGRLSKFWNSLTVWRRFPSYAPAQCGESLRTPV